MEYLLVGERKNPNKLVLPKGHIEAGEEPRETAVREVKEESGYWARVIQCLDNKLLGEDGHVAQTRFYLMELVEVKHSCISAFSKLARESVNVLRRARAWMGNRPSPLEPPDADWRVENRSRNWFSIKDAVEKAEYRETKELLTKADRVLGELERKKAALLGWSYESR